MSTLSTPLYTAPGDILSTNAEAARTALTALVQSTPEGAIVALDLRATRLVDSVGLNLVVSTIKQARIRRIIVRIHVKHPNLIRIFTFTRLHQHAEITENPPV